jgi:hypothetical protein
MNIKQANLAVRLATIWGAIFCVFGLISAIVIFANAGKVPMNPEVQIPWNPYYQTINTLFTAVLVFGLCKKNLLCAIVLIVNLVGRNVYIIIATEHFFVFLPTVSIVLYVWAILGILFIKQQHDIQGSTELSQ